MGQSKIYVLGLTKVFDFTTFVQTVVALHGDPFAPTYAAGTSLFSLKALTFYLYTLHGLAVFSVKSSEGELQEMSALEEYSGCKVESRK